MRPTLRRKLKDLPAALAADKAAAEKKVADLKADNAPGTQVAPARKGTRGVPEDVAAARVRGPSNAAANAAARRRRCSGTPAFPTATTEESARHSRRNFLALIFCLMVGTAALPHILMRYYTTPRVKEARDSVTWSLFFIFLLYFTAPALAVLAKYEVFTVLIGTHFDQLPAWIAAWAKVDPSLLSITDINKDGILQLIEIDHWRRHHRAGHAGNRRPALCDLGPGGGRRPGSGAVHCRRPAADHRQRAEPRPLLQDARPECVHRPSGDDVQDAAAGGGPVRRPRGGAKTGRHPVPGVGSVLVRGGGFFPVLVLGIFWKRANAWGASLGMVAGLGITVYYMVMTQPWLRGIFGVHRPSRTLLVGDSAHFGRGVRCSAGLRGIIIVSLLTPKPEKEIQDLVEHVRYPNLEGDAAFQANLNRPGGRLAPHKGPWVFAKPPDGGLFLLLTSRDDEARGVQRTKPTRGLPSLPIRLLDQASPLR